MKVRARGEVCHQEEAMCVKRGGRLFASQLYRVTEDGYWIEKEE